MIFFRGSGRVLLRNAILFVIFPGGGGGVRTPCPPSGSAHVVRGSGHFFTVSRPYSKAGIKSREEIENEITQYFCFMAQCTHGTFVIKRYASEVRFIAEIQFNKRCVVSFIGGIKI